MNTQNETDSDAMLRGQAQILQYIYGALDGMAIRCCVELHIADIINNHGRPTTLSELSTAIDSPSINVDGLRRLMTFLVNRKVFDEMVESEEGKREPLYSLNYCSKWLLCDTNVTLAPLIMMRTDPVTNLPLHDRSKKVFNRVFNEAMACTATITTNAVISHYKDGFLGSKGSVVDVGGGTGIAISEIVKAYPHLKGINFDLSHVVSTAPKYDGVTHVAGDMFKSIPPAETIFMKVNLSS
ncbi:putative (R,S)-reticuline 7-O-methyltransferase [Helianthus debilis subsp. tardiflorus]